MRSSRHGGPEGDAAVPVGTWRGRGAVALLTFVVAIVVGQAVLSLSRVAALDDRRLDAARSGADPVLAVLGNATRNVTELAAFREIVAPARARFAVVFGPDVTADERRRILLVTGRTFLPSSGVSSSREADYLIAIGDVPIRARSGFELVASANGAWLGRTPG